MMVHGPCGPTHTYAVCMKEGTCSKKFPKKYNNGTFFDKDRHVYYQRRESDVYVTRRGAEFDNSNIVPYKHELCLTFYAHINVEYCGWSMLIRYPSVQILCVHQENMQLITFRDRDPLNLIVNDEDKKKTTLTEWLTYNEVHTDGQHLTYIDFPKEFVWYPDSKSWSVRKWKGLGSVGRLVYVHPASGELFYLRLLLCHQKGCKTLRDIRTINKVVYNTFRAACEALGLLGDDKEWHNALEEASFSSTPTELRNLFVQILIFCDVADPMKLWNTNWQNMSDDIPRRPSKNLHIQNLYINDPGLKGFVLYEVQIILYSYSKTLKDFGLPPLSERLSTTNLRPRKIVLAVSSSNIASLLLSAGRTTHSRFKLPLDLTDDSICNIKKNTHVGVLLAEKSLIIWDKSPINDRRCFETLDKTLRDIMDVLDKVFGGKSVMPGGEIRQMLPVKKGSSKAEIIAASIAESHLWSHFKVYTLIENMMLQQPGNGKIGTPETDNNQSVSWITILEEYCIPNTEDAMSKLINFIYDDQTLRKPNVYELQQKAIVCPRNSTTDIINSKILSAVEDILPWLSKTNYHNSGNVVELAMWDDMAHNFNKNEYDSMEKPVIIALSGTSATHYYLNPDIPHLEEFQSQYKAKQEVNPPLAILKERCHDLSQEKIRNRFPLSTLMQQNPDTYRSVRFTCDRTVIGINTTRDWYIFKATISDGTVIAQFTFFTPNANVVTGSDCTQLVNLHDTPSPRKIDFHFDDILNKPMQITSRTEPETELPGGKLSALGSKTPNLLSKETRHGETRASPDTPSQITAGSESPGKKTHDERAAKGIPSKTTSKRPLFQDDPDEQKKKKIE
ncbi:DNA helicase [Tanacetum coccineum]